MFVDVILIIGDRERFVFIDVINTGGFEDLSFDEMADSDGGDDGD